MPIYEYSCRACAHEFEAFIRGSAATPACPECASVDLERVFSRPAIASDATRGVIKRETTRRDHRQAVERVNEQRNYERSHED